MSLHENDNWLDAQIENAQELISIGHTHEATKIAINLEANGFVDEGMHLNEVIREEEETKGENWGVPEDDDTKLSELKSNYV